MIVVVLAHPYPDRSFANLVLARALDGLENVAVRSLYDLYPDLAIDGAAERQALEAASVVVWQHPIYWYSTPALMKLWFEKVLTAGWAWGPGGDALRGKRCLWVATTGGDDIDYSPAGIHGQSFDTFVPAVRQTAEFCGMIWLEPIIIHAARQLDVAELEVLGAHYRARVAELAAEESSPDG